MWSAFQAPGPYVFALEGVRAAGFRASGSAKPLHELPTGLVASYGKDRHRILSGISCYRVLKSVLLLI